MNAGIGAILIGVGIGLVLTDLIILGEYHLLKRKKGWIITLACIIVPIMLVEVLLTGDWYKINPYFFYGSLGILGTVALLGPIMSRLKVWRVSGELQKETRILEKNERAKKMFFDYACNTFFMFNDGVLDEYRKFEISALAEKEWRQEYVAFWRRRLSVDDLTAVNRLRDAWAREALPDLIRMARQGDSFVQLWYAAAIWELARGAEHISESLRKQAMDTALDIWHSLVSEPIKLTKSHRAEITKEMCKALDASTPEEYIVNYAKSWLTGPNARPRH